MASADTPSLPELFPPALVQFVFSPDPFQKSDFPRSSGAQEVEAFVRAKIHSGVSVAALDQLFLLIDHYDVHEVVPQLLSIAQPQPSGRGPSAAAPNAPVPAATRLSIVKTATVAGAPAERARAAVLFHGLSLEVAVDDQLLCGRVVETYEAAMLDLDAAPFSQRLTAAASSLARFETSLEPGDAEKRRRFGEMDALRRRLQRAISTASSKRGILALTNRPERVRVLIRAYLGLPVDYPGYLVDWAARRLRRETWAAQPPVQTERVLNLNLRQEVAAAFRAALPEIEGAAAPDEMKLHQRVAALDAVQFFTGDLTADEHKFLVTSGEGYVLPLSHRQIWPQP